MKTFFKFLFFVLTGLVATLLLLKVLKKKQPDEEEVEAEE